MPLTFKIKNSWNKFHKHFMISKMKCTDKLKQWKPAANDEMGVFDKIMEKDQRLHILLVVKKDKPCQKIPPPLACTFVTVDLGYQTNT